jgi:hypothetical protein
MTRVKRLVRWLSALALPSLLHAWPAFAADDEEAAFDRTPTDCVSTMRIDRTDVLDDQTIVFYMRSRNTAYRNYLPNKCPGLEKSGRFMYTVRSSRLCKVDLITVLEEWGLGFQPGFTCKLGEFHPLSPAEIASLRVEKRRGIRSDTAVKEEPVKPATSDEPATSEPGTEAPPADPATKP